jgi:hypothetical protein
VAEPFAQHRSAATIDLPLKEMARRMKALGSSAAELRAIGRDNAVWLLPNLPRT